MPSAADTFSQIGGSQPGPFSKYLQPTQPLPQDQPMNAPTGWESKGVAGGEIALGFLKGVRQQRVQQFAQQEAVKQGQYDAFLNQVDSILNDSKYDEATKSMVARYRADIHAQHFQAETAKVQKGGVGEFFKNIMANLTGGQMQGSKPINLPEAHANLAVMTTGPEATKAHWRALADNKLAEVTSAAAASGYPLSQAQVQQHAAQIASQLDLQSHLGQDTNAWIAGAAMTAPADPMAESMQRARQRRLNELGYGSQAPPQAVPPGGAPQTEPPPQLNYTPMAGYTPATTQPPPGAAAAPTSAVPPGNILPENTGAAATPRPLDFRDPIDLQIIKGIGRDVSGIDHPETYYDLSDPTHQRAVPNLVRHPVTNRLVDRFTGQPHPEAEGYTPASQAKFPRADPVTSVTGGESQNGPFYQGHRDKAGNWVADLDKYGNKVFAPLPTPLTPIGGGTTGEQWGEKKPGIAIPPPRPPAQTPKEIEQDKANAGAQSLLEAAGGDPTWAQEMLPQSKLPDNIKALVRKNLEEDARQKQLEDPTVKVKWMLAARERAASKGSSAPPAAPGAKSAAPPGAPKKLKRLPDNK